MQQSNAITFEPIRHTTVLHAWEIVLALILFAGLIFVAVWRSRKRSKEDASLRLGGQ